MLTSRTWRTSEDSDLVIGLRTIREQFTARGAALFILGILMKNQLSLNTENAIDIYNNHKETRKG